MVITFYPEGAFFLSKHVSENVSLSSKRAMKKLMEKFIEPYVVKKIVSENTVKLELPVVLRIYLVINVRRIVKYKE